MKNTAHGRRWPITAISKDRAITYILCILLAVSIVWAIRTSVSVNDRQTKIIKEQEGIRRSIGHLQTFRCESIL